LVGEARKVGGRRSLTACVERAPPQKNGNTRQTYCFAKDTGMRAGGGDGRGKGILRHTPQGRGWGGGAGRKTDGGAGAGYQRYGHARRRAPSVTRIVLPARRKVRR